LQEYLPAYYYTSKDVKIKHRGLSVLYYLLFILIIVYGVVDVIFQQSYLAFENPDGAIRLKLKNPKNYTTQTTQPPYCNDVQCIPLDSFSVAYPATQTTGPSILVTSRLQEQFFHKTKLGSWKENKNERKQYYVTNVEDFVVKVYGTVTFPDTENGGDDFFSSALHKLKGKLEGKNGEELMAFEPTDSEHEIPLLTWLEAAGVSLDETSDSNSVKENFDKFRDEGMILNVEIYAYNLDNRGIIQWIFGNTPHPQFAYRVSRVPKSEFKMIETVSQGDVISEFLASDTRKVLKKHGVYFQFSVTGSFARFSWFDLLMHLISAFALVGFATVIVDSFMLYISAHKTKYSDIKTEEIVLTGIMKKET